jgi:pyruvate/2-oxoglutarate dehydrogenase complex dihydrolipoamide dehydrogenase (E3) component
MRKDYDLTIQDPDVSETIARVLQSEEVTLLTGARVQSAELRGRKKRIMDGEARRTTIGPRSR